MSEVILKWYGQAVSNLLDKANLSGITASAISVEDAIVKEIERQEIVKTGRYKGSITFKSFLLNSEPTAPATGKDTLVSKPERYEAIIGTNLVYAPKLEYVSKKGGVPRAAIRKGWDSIKNKLEFIYTQQFKKIYK
jgi:hypothetical protein